MTQGRSLEAVLIRPEAADGESVHATLSVQCLRECKFPCSAPPLSPTWLLSTSLCAARHARTSCCRLQSIYSLFTLLPCFGARLCATHIFAVCGGPTSPRPSWPNMKCRSLCAHTSVWKRDLVGRMTTRCGFLLLSVDAK